MQPPARRTGSLPLALASLAATALACGPRSAPAPASTATAAVAADVTALTIPVGPGSEAALAALTGADPPAAAWQRAVYLIELFDDARFRRDDASLGLLRRAMGTTDGAASDRGAALTASVVAWLGGAVAALAPAAAREADIAAARTLLAFDASPPTRLVDVPARLAALIAVVSGAGDLADAARLRLAGWCRRALEDAREAPASERPGHAAHCLQALTRIDAVPWLSGAPPEVPWDAIDRGATALLDPVIAKAGRLALAAASERRTLVQLIGILAGDEP